MIRFGELSEFQKSYVTEYIANNPKSVLNEQPEPAGVMLEVSLPERFFLELQLAETKGVDKPARGRGGDGAGMGMFDGSENVRSLGWIRKIMHDCYQLRQRRFDNDRRASGAGRRGQLSSTPSPSRATSRRDPSAAASEDVPVSVARRRRGREGTGSSQKRVDVVDDMAATLFQLLSKKYGMGNLVKRAGAEALEAVRFYRNVDLEVQLFGALVSSAAYDTSDVEAFLELRNVLLPYLVTRHDTRSGVTRQYVHTRQIPALLRKVLPSDSQWAVLRRCRHALGSWCNRYGKFPAPVPDPNFYTPPFSRSNPYVAQTPYSDLQAEVDEERFLEFNTLVDVGQFYFLVLLNMKQERLTPSTKPKATAQKYSGEYYRSDDTAVQATPLDRLATPQRRYLDAHSESMINTAMALASSPISRHSSTPNSARRRGGRSPIKQRRGFASKLNLSSASFGRQQSLSLVKAGDSASNPSGSNPSPDRDKDQLHPSSSLTKGSLTKGKKGASLDSLPIMESEDEDSGQSSRRSPAEQASLRHQSMASTRPTTGAGAKAPQSVKAMENELHRLVNTFATKY